MQPQPSTLQPQYDDHIQVLDQSEVSPGIPQNLNGAVQIVDVTPTTLTVLGTKVSGLKPVPLDQVCIVI